MYCMDSSSSIFTSKVPLLTLPILFSRHTYMYTVCGREGGEGCGGVGVCWRPYAELQDFYTLAYCI
jgi:hypothetical protein